MHRKTKYFLQEIIVKRNIHFPRIGNYVPVFFLYQTYCKNYLWINRSIDGTMICRCCKVGHHWSKFWKHHTAVLNIIYTIGVTLSQIKRIYCTQKNTHNNKIIMQSECCSVAPIQKASNQNVLLRQKKIERYFCLLLCLSTALNSRFVTYFEHILP